MSLSPYEQMKQLPKEEQIRIINQLPKGIADDMTQMPWWFLARPEQIEPKGDWNVWLILAGRGWGKTRSCAEWLTHQVVSNPTSPDGTPTEWAVIAETFSDTRTVCVEGPSGLLHALARHGFKKDAGLNYNRSSWQLRLSTGQRIHMLGADSPDAGRGFNLSGVWADELAKWRYPWETWVEGLAPSLRIGNRPRAVVATTPKPNKLLIDWVSRQDGSVHVTRGSTFENAANLSKTALVELKKRYEGTRVGRQELYGELLVDVPGALWTRAMIDAAKEPIDFDSVVWQRIVVAIDPAVSTGESADETGIIVAGLDVNGIGYIIKDLSDKVAPRAWAQIAVDAYYTYNADRIIAEANNGGQIVEAVMRTIDQNVPYRPVWASRGKMTRAEPIASMYEQGKVKHAAGLERLEDQMSTWLPGSKSPDRLDAMVWAMTDLMTRSEWIVI